MGAALIVLQFFLFVALLAVYAERKTAAFIQDRLGPYEVGPYGLLQPVADILKLLQKQEVLPLGAQRTLFRLGPVLCFMSLFCALGFLPLLPGIQHIGTPLGLLLVLAVLVLDILGIMLAGWSSGNKFATYGTFRALGQLIAYEVPLGFVLASVVLSTGSLDLVEIAAIQTPDRGLGQQLGFLSWLIITHPLLSLGLVIFFICAMAQAHRTPFDLPEAEGELVAGYHTEYSGFRWSLFMLAEYGVLFLMSWLMGWIFLGAGHSPWVDVGELKLKSWTTDTESWGFWFAFWSLSKAFFIMWLQMWIRWSLPRIRPDQLLYFCWKILTPLSIVLLYLVSLYTLLR